VIWLQSPTVFWLGGRIISLNFVNALGVSDVRQSEIYTAVPLLFESNAFMAIVKIKKTNHLVLIEYQQNCLKLEVEKFAVRSINLLIRFEIRRNCLRCGKSHSLYLSTRRATKEIVVIIGTYNFCKLRTEFYRKFCSKG